MKQVGGHLLALAVLVLPIRTAHAADSPYGHVTCDPPTSVHDGDTFRCKSGDRDFPVRVAGIDAPETGQAFWRVSRDLLRTLLGKGSLVDCYKTDAKYDRQVCRVMNVSGRDVALEMVQSGLAWHSTTYRHEQSEAEQDVYARAEHAARSGRLGLWSQADPLNPGECRALKRQSRSCR